MTGKCLLYRRSTTEPWECSLWNAGDAEMSDQRDDLESCGIETVIGEIVHDHVMTWFAKEYRDMHADGDALIAIVTHYNLKDKFISGIERRHDIDLGEYADRVHDHINFTSPGESVDIGEALVRVERPTGCADGECALPPLLPFRPVDSGVAMAHRYPVLMMRAA